MKCRLMLLFCLGVIPISTQGQVFTLDFNNRPDSLNPFNRDSSGKLTGTAITSADVTAADAPTPTVDVANLWNSIGITISTDVTRPGLYDSLTRSSDSTNDDPDIETGPGIGIPPDYPGALTVPTTDQGNLLIIEENPGNSRPDDRGTGGTMTISISTLLVGQSLLSTITMVDDVEGTIVVTDRDGKTTTITLDTTAGQNEQITYSFGDVDAETIEFNFDSSGGVANLFFSNYEQIPEPSSLLVVLITTAFFVCRRRYLN